MAWTGASEFESRLVGGWNDDNVFTAVAELNGKIAGDLLALVGELTISGSMGHDVTIRGGQLSIGPHAEIVGQTKYTGEIISRKFPQARSSASPVQVTFEKRGPNYSHGSYYWHQILFWGAGFLLGLVIMFVTPGFFFDVSQACKRIGPAIGFGALFLFATPIAALIVCATIVGLSVGIPALLLYAIAVYATKIFVGAWLGEKLLGASVGFGPAVGRLALGLAILRALRMLPYVGLLVGLLTVMMGLGAIVLSLHRRITPTAAVATA